MSEVKRILPESKTELINWIEQNFHDIDTFVVTFNLKDGTTMTVYDCYSFVEALGLTGVMYSTISQQGNDGEFIPKERW